MQAISKRVSCAAVVGVVLWVGLTGGQAAWAEGQGAAAGSQGAVTGGTLIDALRNDDAAAVTSLIKQGADVKAADDTGATPLMYAALYAGPECLQTLIDRGASVNAANKYGATPLMWAAISSERNVRLLVDRGADVNAKASDGVTALVAAARLNNIGAMRILLAAGADTRTADIRTKLITAAYYSPTPEVREVLEFAGVVLTSPRDLKGSVLNRNRGDIATLRHLLAAGIDPKEETVLNTVSLPSAFMAAREGQLAALQAFVDAGMDPNAVASRGWTALMLTAGADTPSTAVLRYLIDAGADINAKDADGHTALDWALTRGVTSVSQFLESAGAKRNASLATALPPAPVATPRTAAAAVARAVAMLQPAGPAFSNRTKCNSCHNQTIPGIAITLAQHHGVSIDETLADHSMSATNQQWRARFEATLLGDSNNGGFQPNATYTLLEMAESRMAPTTISDMLAIGLASKQNDDGSWTPGNEIRPPLNGGPLTGTALAIKGLRDYTPTALRAGMQPRVTRAVVWLRRAEPRDTQEQAFKMLGLLWGGGSESEVQQQRSALLALQRADGGWGQMPSMASDAYATGQALWALHAAGLPTADPAYQHGATHLLRTQLEDGTWFVQTRAFGFQTYFETGFSHGRSQFISTAATAWAAIALTHTIETTPSTGHRPEVTGALQSAIR